MAPCERLCASLAYGSPLNCSRVDEAADVVPTMRCPRPVRRAPACNEERHIPHPTAHQLRGPVLGCQGRTQSIHHTERCEARTSRPQRETGSWQVRRPNGRRRACGPTWGVGCRLSCTQAKHHQSLCRHGGHPPGGAKHGAVRGRRTGRALGRIVAQVHMGRSSTCVQSTSSPFPPHEQTG